MKPVQFIRRLWIAAAFGALPVLVSNCGTSSSVDQQLTAPPPHGAVYIIGSCNSRDDRASSSTCDDLRENVRYGLFKRGLYAKSGDQARRKVDLTITYFRNVSSFNRAMGGVMTGKDGLDVTARVTDIQSGRVLGSTNISSFNFSAVNTTEDYLISEVGNKIVEFLFSGSE